MNTYIWGGIMTDEIIRLLSERNRHLSQFSVLNKIQIGKIEQGDYEQINEFYTAREHILAIVEKIEIVINQKSKDAATKISMDQKQNIEILLNNKDQIIREILEQDLQILSSIEQEKSNIITELKVLQKGKKTIKAYKSGITSNKLDEDV